MNYDVVVIGGGIVGLATALKILERDSKSKVCVLEKETRLAQHQTGNNSGVIHSGIYYKPGSLRATNCLRGYRMLLDFAKAENIPHEICGKIIVATHESELPRLQNIFERGQQNGLTGLQELDAPAFKKIEPHVAGLKAVFVPQTGIIDYSRVAEKYAERIIALGGKIHLKERVIGFQKNGNDLFIKTEKNHFNTRFFINCAGLYSDKIAALSGVTPPVQIVPFRGEYYVVKKDRKHLVRHLIYPVPDPTFPFLGVHFTRLIAGGIEAGPNAVLAYAREGYTKSKIHLREFLEIISFKGFQKLATKHWRTGAGELYRSYSKAAFTKALQKLIPEIRAEDLIKGGAGVRASATWPDGTVVDDFLIQDSEQGIHVLNSPSPAATASLSIGLEIADRYFLAAKHI